MVMLEGEWRIELLGGLRARWGESRCIARFQTHKTAALLAYLAYYLPRRHPREGLIEMLWPDRCPEKGRRSLRVALTSLRHQLEPPGVPAGAVIVADRSTVGLQAVACVTDVAEFDAALRGAARADGEDAVALLESAVGLYGGELLPGFYDEWIDPERIRLAVARLDALHRLVQQLERVGRLDRALEYARQAVVADPLNEAAHRTVMSLYAALGHAEAGLQQYRELERRLREELDTNPDPATRALSRELARRVHRTASEGSAVSKDENGVIQAEAVAERDAEAVRSRAAPDHTTPQEQMPSLGRGDAVSEAGSARSDNLPLLLDRFFGREQELTQMRAILSSVTCRGPRTAGRAMDELGPVNRGPRLVTLLGPGGSGKTRLALEAAAGLRDAFVGGVWYVPLVHLDDPLRIVDAVAEALSLAPDRGADPLDQIAAKLALQPALLVLDNLEHLREAGTLAVLPLLERVPTLICLATSRQRLNIRGERVFPVPPLPTPGSGVRVFGCSGVREGQAASAQRPNTPARQHRGTVIPEHPNTRTPEHLTLFPSVQLFVDRAQAVVPDFQVTLRNAEAVAAVCDALDGIPLAIELAAARMSIVSPAGILRALAQRRDVLVSRRKDDTTRHRSLRAAMEWSYDLLSPEAQRLFAHASVFRGGWTLEAAEAVCGDAHVLDGLAQLRECSMIVAEDDGEEVRFRMLETLREFGAQQVIPQQWSALGQRHARYYAALAEECSRQFGATEEALWLDALEKERNNLRAVFQGLIQRGEAREGFQLAGMLWRYWFVRGRWTEGLQQLVELLGGVRGEPRSVREEAYLADSSAAGAAHTDAHSPELEAARAKALREAAAFASIRGDRERARGWYEESLAICRRLGDRRGTAAALADAGLFYRLIDRDKAETLLTESLAIRRALKDPSGVAETLFALGEAALARGDMAAGHACLEESLAIRRQQGDKAGVAFGLLRLGNVAHGREEYSQARALFAESLAIERELGRSGGIAQSLTKLGEIARDEGDYPRARSAFEDSLTLHREMGFPRGIAHLLHLLGNVARCQGDHGHARACFEEGLAIRQGMGERHSVAAALDDLGLLASDEGDLARAGALLRESLTLWQALEPHWRYVTCLERVGGLARLQGRMERAVRLLGAAEGLRFPVAGRRLGLERAEFDRHTAAARAALGQAAFEAAWTRGRAMAREEAIREALREA